MSSVSLSPNSLGSMRPYRGKLGNLLLLDISSKSKLYKNYRFLLCIKDNLTKDIWEYVIVEKIKIFTKPTRVLT